MTIERAIDIEDEIRKALDPYIQTYCRPLPKSFKTPSILVSQVGGMSADKVDTFDVALDARASDSASALEALRNAIGVLRANDTAKNTAIRWVAVNTMGSWGVDPVRPELAMCSARLRVTAHCESIEIGG